MKYKATFVIELQTFSFRQKEYAEPQHSARHMAIQFLAHLDLVSPLTSFVAEGENGLPVATGGKSWKIEFQAENPAEGNRKLLLRMEAGNRKMLKEIQKSIELYLICTLDVRRYEVKADG